MSNRFLNAFKLLRSVTNRFGGDGDKKVSIVMQ